MAIVNCLNFGNPEHPEVMWQLAEAIDGMSEASRELGVPVVGGNVSLYNSSRGRDIDPTPVIGMVGVVERLEGRPPGVRLVDGGRLLLLGEHATALGGSAWAALHDHRGGRLPELDYDRHRAVLEVVRQLVTAGLVAGVHDVSDGGLAVALAEMAVRSGVGARLSGVTGHAELFSEAPSRVLLCALPAEAAVVVERCHDGGVPVTLLGGSGGDRLVVEGLLDLALETILERWRGALPVAVAGEGAP